MSDQYNYPLRSLNSDTKFCAGGNKELSVPVPTNPTVGPTGVEKEGNVKEVDDKNDHTVGRDVLSEHSSDGKMAPLQVCVDPLPETKKEDICKDLEPLDKKGKDCAGKSMTKSDTLKKIYFC